MGASAGSQSNPASYEEVRGNVFSEEAGVVRAACDSAGAPLHGGGEGAG